VADAVWVEQGRAVVVSSNASGRFNLWRVPARGGRPTPLTHSEQRQQGLSVSRDGRDIAFESDFEGDERWDVWVMRASGGEPHNVTNTPDIAETQARFSPVGSRLAIMHKRLGEAAANIAVIELRTGEVRVLTHEREAYLWSPVAWSPDGDWLVVNRASIGRARGEIWRIDVFSGQRTLLTPSDDGGAYAAAALSKDGRRLALTRTPATGVSTAEILDLVTGRRAALRDDVWDQEALEFTPDGRHLLVSTNGDGRTSLDLLEIGGASSVTVHLPRGVTRAATRYATPFARDGRVLVLHESASARGRLLVASPGGRSSQVLMGEEPASSLALPASQIVTYRSDDGTLISALMLIPNGVSAQRPAPAIVFAHGGPAAQTMDRFDPILAGLASRGYVVIAPNPRGSTGYGTAFRVANRGDLGGRDLDDYVAGLRFLVATGLADPERVGITGQSYGGYMTLMAIGRYPQLWRAAVARYGIVDWKSMYGTQDPRLRELQRFLLGDPDANADVYRRASPLTYLSGVRAPLLVLQGARDVRVPLSQAEAIGAVMRDRGTEFDLHVYPDEGHGFVRTENRIDALRRTLDWFESHFRRQAVAASDER
jgi:dipeptidyl aminopeptidase/acylaminoacyl peptidase